MILIIQLIASLAFFYMLYLKTLGSKDAKNAEQRKLLDGELPASSAPPDPLIRDHTNQSDATLRELEGVLGRASHHKARRYRQIMRICICIFIVVDAEPIRKRRKIELRSILHVATIGLDTADEDPNDTAGI